VFLKQKKNKVFFFYYLHEKYLGTNFIGNKKKIFILFFKSLHESKKNIFRIKKNQKGKQTTSFTTKVTSFFSGDFTHFFFVGSILASAYDRSPEICSP